MATVNPAFASLLPRIGEKTTDVPTWYRKIKTWFNICGIVEETAKFNWIYMSAEGEAAELLTRLMEDSEETPTLEKCKEVLYKWYGYEDQEEDTLEKLKKMRIGRNETIKDFNNKYQLLYNKLKKEDREAITIHDYKSAVEPNYSAWCGVVLEGGKELETAFKAAEKFDKLNKGGNNSHILFRRTTTGSKGSNRFASMKNPESVKRDPDEKDINNLIQGMKNLKIKTCFYCQQPGHIKKDCPMLNNENTNLEEKNNLNY